jgi:DNA-binding transcriptional ArsR family regulator
MAREITHPAIEHVALTTVMAALSDPVRLSIVRLAASEHGLPCRAFEQQIPKSTLSHHWRVLREAGLIRQEGQGTSRMNFLRRAEFDGRFPGLLDAVLAADAGTRSPA